MFAGTITKYSVSGRCPALIVTFQFFDNVLNGVHLGLSEKELVTQFVDAPSEVERRLRSWLEMYLQGKEESITPFLELPEIGTFSKRVLQELILIPFGQTISYQTLAKRIDAPLAARSVGSACHRNPFPLLIPCHRVIRKNGSIGGFACNIEIKRRLLKFEKTIRLYY